MIVEKINNGDYVDYLLIGSVLSIDGDDYDLEQLQEDDQKIIDIKKNDRFIANIIIPPAKYKEVDSGSVDENSEAIYENIKIPLDTESVKLNLWSVIKEEKQGEI